MKILQRLVLDCDKVTGKALMLDEIINYVQSLQNPVEFLSMKLASVNPLFYDFGMELNAYKIRPERLYRKVSPPPVQQCSPTRLTAFAEPNTSTTTTTTTATLPILSYQMITTTSLMLQVQFSFKGKGLMSSHMKWKNKDKNFLIHLVSPTTCDISLKIVPLCALQTSALCTKAR